LGCDSVMIRLPSIYFLIWGCSTPVEETVRLSSVVPNEPELDVSVVEERIRAGLDKGFPSPIRLRDLYGSFLSERESWCPHMENQGSDTWHGVWFDDCSTLGGFSFWGTAVFFEFTEPNWSMEAMASYEMTDPQGYVFLGGGEYELDFVLDESWSFRVGGTFTYEPYGGWFAERGEASLFLTATFSEGSMNAELDGGIGFDDIEFYFDGLIFDDAQCDGLPQGVLMVRDSSTFWFSIPLKDCSSCGDLIWNGEEKGEVCVGEELRSALSVLRSEVESGP
jgi:hypothetical protein